MRRGICAVSKPKAKKADGKRRVYGKRKSRDGKKKLRKGVVTGEEGEGEEGEGDGGGEIVVSR